jgi:hypothetical protein
MWQAPASADTVTEGLQAGARAIVRRGGVNLVAEGGDGVCHDRADGCGGTPVTGGSQESGAVPPL